VYNLITASISLQVHKKNGRLKSVFNIVTINFITSLQNWLALLQKKAFDKNFLIFFKRYFVFINYFIYLEHYRQLLFLRYPNKNFSLII